MRSVAEANGLRQSLQLHYPLGNPSRASTARLRRYPQHNPLRSTVFSARAAGHHHLPGKVHSTKRFYHATNLIGAEAAAPAPPKPPEILTGLLDAVQSQNNVKILKELKLLGRHERHDDVKDALNNLSPVAFSELIRCLDPFRVGPKVDVAHGLQIQQGLRQFSAVASVNNQFGIRKLYQTALQLVRAIIELRAESGRSLMLSDYVVLLRCAGAASDIESAKWAWKVAMNVREGARDVKDGLAYTEFFKARFLTEPLYTQHDIAKLRMRPRNLFKRKRFTVARSLRPLDRLRISIAANSTTHYGRCPTRPTHDMSRLVSLPRPVRRLWDRVRKTNVAVDEEFYCAYMLACARAGSLREMTRLLSEVWGINITDLKDHRNTLIGGGYDRERLDESRQPTERLLNAVVHSFGCTGDVILASKMMIFISHRYQIPIPSNTWSSLLEWTYVVSSKPASTEWKIIGDPNRIIHSDDVLSIWDAMTSEEFQVNISFKDMDIYTKTLISAGRLDEAWEAIRRGCAHYESLSQDVERALFEKLYPSPPPETNGRLLRAKTKTHTTWYSIQRWCMLWLREGSKRHRQTDLFSSRIVTDFVSEFKWFLPDPITYRTSGGVVRIVNQESPRTHLWKKNIGRSASTQMYVPDKSCPKRIDVKGEDGEEEEPVPLLTESGEPVFESMPITLQRWTMANRRRRTEAKLGANDKKLDLLVRTRMNRTQPGATSEGQGQQVQSGRYLDKAMIRRSLVW